VISPGKMGLLIREALREDIGSGDVTSLALLSPRLKGRGTIVAGQAGVICGTKMAEQTFRRVDPRLKVRVLKRDGSRVKKGARVLALSGRAASILAGERTALNFLARLSGIATLTSKFVEKVKGTRAKILDTRKTTPGWRELEKYAVKCGGGVNHRMRLDDLILIKDNHLASLKHKDAIAAAVQRARKKYPRLRVEVECDRLAQIGQAARARADVILLDNMTPAQMKRAVRKIRGSAKIEASGGVTLANVRRIAATGVDFISVGALTHSAPAMDFSLEVE
jgi:nicotinate-nucleotide pyrophosphorylase (carboxylating)